jgi:hypothetical protein
MVNDRGFIISETRRKDTTIPFRKAAAIGFGFPLRNRYRFRLRKCLPLILVTIEISARGCSS